jgi:hypothetical protein
VWGAGSVVGHTVLAPNLPVLLQRLALGPGWLGKRLQAMRCGRIGSPGRVAPNARGRWIQRSQGHPALPVLLGARQRLRGLPRGSPGSGC